MPALREHPRKDESFEIGEEILQTPEERSGSSAGLTKGVGREAMAASVEGGCMHRYC